MKSTCLQNCFELFTIFKMGFSVFLFLCFSFRWFLLRPFQLSWLVYNITFEVAFLTQFFSLKNRPQQLQLQQVQQQVGQQLQTIREQRQQMVCQSFHI